MRILFVAMANNIHTALLRALWHRPQVLSGDVAMMLGRVLPGRSTRALGRHLVADRIQARGT